MAGAPTVLAANCDTGAADEIEQTAAASAAQSLIYDAASGQYVYTWKTATSMKGCRTLVLTFRDGSVMTMLFELR